MADSNVGNASFGTIDALRPDASGINLVVKVLNVGNAVDRPSKHGGKPQKIAECLVGDATGTIIFSARNNQVELFKVGSFLTLRNARVEMVRGNMRLAVTQGGKIESAPDTTEFTPKTDLNLSLIEYELVPVPDELIKGKV